MSCANTGEWSHIHILFLCMLISNRMILCPDLSSLTLPPSELGKFSPLSFQNVRGDENCIQVKNDQTWPLMMLLSK